MHPQIEQYEELVRLAHVLADTRKAKRESLNRFFGHLPRWYEMTDEAGERVMVVAGELSTDVLNTIEANQQIEDIEVGYCLDGYNQFYRQTMALIEAHLGDDVQQCALAILRLYRKL